MGFFFGFLGIYLPPFDTQCLRVSLEYEFPYHGVMPDALLVGRHVSVTEEFYVDTFHVVSIEDKLV